MGLGAFEANGAALLLDCAGLNRDAAPFAGGRAEAGAEAGAEAAELATGAGVAAPHAASSALAPTSADTFRMKSRRVAISGSWFAVTGMTLLVESLAVC